MFFGLLIWVREVCDYKSISKSPIYLTRGGNVNPERGSLRSAAITGDYSTTTASLWSQYEYALVFHNTGIYAADYSTRWSGLTVWALPGFVFGATKLGV